MRSKVKSEYQFVMFVGNGKHIIQRNLVFLHNQSNFICCDERITYRNIYGHYNYHVIELVVDTSVLYYELIRTTCDHRSHGTMK